jgi:hypothetical protein
VDIVDISYLPLFATMVAKKAQKNAKNRIYFDLWNLKSKNPQKTPEIRIYSPRKYRNTKFNKGIISPYR